MGPHLTPQMCLAYCRTCCEWEHNGPKEKWRYGPFNVQQLKKMIFQSNHLIILNPRHPINPKDKKTQVKKSHPPLKKVSENDVH